MIYDTFERFSLGSDGINDINESVATRNVFYRLSESKIFEIANSKTKINGETIINVLPKMVMDGHGFMHVGIELFSKEMVYELFESSRFSITCKKQIRKLIETGKLILCYSETYKIPTSIPFTIAGNGNNTVIYCNISDFVKVDEYGNVYVSQPRNYNGLMSLFFAASIAYVFSYKKHVSFVPTSNDALCIMYSNMMEKTINGLCHLDTFTKDKVRYLSMAFILVQMYGTEYGIQRFETLKKKYIPTITPMVANAIDNNFKLDNYDNIDIFINGLKEMFPLMKKVTLNNVFEKWIKLYGASTALSIDYIGYHIYTFSMLMFESPLVSRIALETTINVELGARAYKVFQEQIGTNEN